MGPRRYDSYLAMSNDDVIYLGQFSRMAYIKDYELRQIFIEKRSDEGELIIPCDICDKGKKSVDYKWGEISSS